MFEKIKSVKISGMCFGDTHPPLELFPNESQRVSIMVKTEVERALLQKHLKIILSIVKPQNYAWIC